MTRKKKTEIDLPPSGLPVDVSALGVSGGKPKNGKRKSNNRGCGCLLLIIILGSIFLASAPKKPSDVVAQAATYTPLGGVAPIIPTFTETPDTPALMAPTMTEVSFVAAAILPTLAPTQTEMFFPTALPAQAELESAYTQIDGITSVDMVSVRGGIAYAEITHRAGVNREAIANQMLQLALQETRNASLSFSVIFTDEQTCEDWMFDLGTDDWRTTSLTCPSAPIVLFTPEAGLGTEIDPATYYAGSSGANIRDCAKTSCTVLTKLAASNPIVSNYVVNGDSVDTGNAIWYRVQYNGVTGYVYSGVVSSVKPTTTNTASQPSNPPVVVVPSNNQSVVPVESARTWDCSGDYYNCDSFGSRAEMRSYFEQCPGDPSNLDGNADGQYCES
jgi:hypothetical protein